MCRLEEFEQVKTVCMGFELVKVLDQLVKTTFQCKVSHMSTTNNYSYSYKVSKFHDYIAWESMLRFVTT